MLEIALLGGFSMRTKGQVVTVHLSRAARWVLAYLALDPHHEADRIRLAHLFWPDSSEHQARTNLRKTLSELRHVPPIAPLLAMSHGRVALADGGWTVDVRRFLAAAESVSLPRLTEAVDVYRGDLLPEDDAEWLLPERGRLRLLYLQTLDRLVDLLGSRGEWAEAQRYADRAVSHDPWYEGGWLRLFRTLAAQKDGSGIERAWRQLSTLWQREMDEDPPRTLAAAYLAARESIVPADNPALLDTAWRERWQQRVRRLFVGRQAERQRFEDWLADPDARVLTVWGPGGIGKTTLLQMLASRAAETGRIVVWLDGHEMQPQPASFLASIRPGRPADVWGWLEKTSPLIFIDSLEAVVPLADWIARRFLPRLVSSARLVVASRYTPAMLWPPDVPWRQTAWAWELTGWSREEVMEYLARRGVTDPAHVDGIWQLCQGHPLAVALAADAAATDRGQIPLGDRLRRDIIPVLADHLLRDLPTPSMRRLVEAAAVVRLVDLSLLRVLAAVLEVPLSEVPAVWRLLMRSAAFAAAPRGLRWHDDVRSFVAAHFRWEDPDAAAGVEDAAWSYLADRLRQAAADEREALLAEWLALSGDGVLTRIVFPDEALGSVDVATGHPAQREACVSLWAAWASRFAPDGLPPSRYEQVRRVLATPGVRWHTYWYDGRMQAFSAVVPLTQRTWGVLLPNPTFGPLLTWYRFRCPGPPPLEPELSQVHVVAYVAAAADAPKQVVAGLLQDIIRVIAQPGIYLVATPDPTYQAVATVLGAQPLPELTNYPYGPNNPCRYYVLDLLTTRFDQWIRERMGMRRRQG